MKKYILPLLLMTTTAQAGIFKGRYNGELPKTCEVVFSKEYIETTGTLKGDVAEVLHNALLYTRKILDLKFESHSYFVANRDSYGEYIKYKQMKDDFEAGVEDAEARKKIKLEATDALINDLAKIEKNLAKKIYGDISNERENEIERYNQIIRSLTKNWDKNKYWYYQALAVWSPYQNNLENLSSLEKSLMETLKHLADINTASEESLKELVNEIHTWRHEEATMTCKTIDEKFQKMAKSL